MSKAEFMARIEDELGPILSDMGFKEHAGCWKRVREPFVDCVEVQTRSDDVACCVNFGEHLVFLPVAGASTVPDVDCITYVDCEIKGRLAPQEEAEHWWNFEEGAAGVADLICCFQNHAETFFGKYQDFPRPFTNLEPSDIDSDTALGILPMMTKVRRILLLARVHDYVGDRSRALAWARFGKINAGMAVGPKAAFREIVKKCESRVGDSGDDREQSGGP